VKDATTQTDATLPVDPTTMGASPAIARNVGRFVVIDVLGQGAMGLVLAAYDPDLDRKVAVKLLRPDAYDATSREGRERMLREARALAKLSHPNVIAIHEVGTVDDRIFLAMEFAPGGTLRSWLAADKRTWRDVLAKLVQAGRGLAAAHDAGLVHRDFKPTNVLLAKNDDARVADFGLVGGQASKGPTSDAGNGPVELTHTGALLGTPAYMAPEQFEPDAGETIGPAADQFAFCVSAWECLHGARPFEGATLGAISENVRANRVVEPADSDVPPWVRAVLRRGFAPKPADRWPSMSVLLDALARDPVAARARRARIALVGMAAAGVITTVALVASRSADAGPQCEYMERSLAGVWNDTHASAIRDAFARSGAPHAAETATHVTRTISDYTTAWVAARRASCEATHVHGDQSADLLDREIACLDRRLVSVDALVTLLADSPSRDVVDRALQATLQLPDLASCADADALRPTASLPTDPVKRSAIASVRVQLASVKALGDTAQYRLARARANDLVTRANEIGYTPLVAETLERRAKLEASDGDPRASLLTFDAALLAAAEDDRLFASLIGSKMHVLGNDLQRSSEALALRPVAEAALRRAGDDRITTAAVLTAIGRVLVTHQKLREAREVLEKALAITEEVHGRDSHEATGALTSLANALYAQRLYPESIALFERSAAIWRTRFGPDHPDVHMIEGNIANVYYAKGDYAEAAARYERILSAMVRLLGPVHPLVADVELNLANSLNDLNRFDEAIARYQRSIAIKTDVYGAEHADIAQIHYALGTLYYEMDRYPEALAAHAKSVAMYEAVGLGESEKITFPLTQLAEVTLHIRPTEESLPIAERGLALREKSEIRESEVMYSRLVVGRILLELDRDRPRALTLIGDARAYFVSQGEDGASRVVLVDRILAAYKR
jgi:tetratricopeptide (TPR) repeat protein/tRNA A-37 threonylcarbamoyl transferase component Bud32